MIVASSDCTCKGFNITNGANSNNPAARDAATFLEGLTLYQTITP
jgi:hypothetical protein